MLPVQSSEDIQYATHPKATPSFYVCPREYDCGILATQLKGHWCQMLCCSESNLVEGALDHLKSHSFEETDQTANTLRANERDVLNFGRPCQAQLHLIREATYELLKNKSCIIRECCLPKKKITYLHQLWIEVTDP